MLFESSSVDTRLRLIVRSWVLDAYSKHLDEDFADNRPRLAFEPPPPHPPFFLFFSFFFSFFFFFHFFFFFSLIFFSLLLFAYFFLSFFFTLSDCRHGSNQPFLFAFQDWHLFQ